MEEKDFQKRKILNKEDQKGKKIRSQKQGSEMGVGKGRIELREIKGFKRGSGGKGVKSRNRKNKEDLKRKQKFHF